MVGVSLASTTQRPRSGLPETHLLRPSFESEESSSSLRINPPFQCTLTLSTQKWGYEGPILCLSMWQLQLFNGN